MRIPRKITAIIGATGKDSASFTLNGALWTGKRAVATDGNQMTILEFADCQENDECHVISSDALKAVKKITPKSTISAEIDIEFGKPLNEGSDYKPTTPQFANDTIKVIQGDSVTAQQSVAHPSGKFPDYERIVPREEDLPIHFCLDAKLLKLVLDVIVNNHDNKRTRCPIRLKFGDNYSPMTIEYQSTDYDTPSVKSVVMPMKEEKTDAKISVAIYKAAKQIRAGNATKGDAA